MSLTYHKDKNHLRCHYCGYVEDKKQICSSCDSNEMIDKGYGTQQIEEELKVLFPDVKSRRMDHDTTRKKNSYSAIIDDFERGNTDIRKLIRFTSTYTDAIAKKVRSTIQALYSLGYITRRVYVQ